MHDLCEKDECSQESPNTNFSTIWYIVWIIANIIAIVLAYKFGYSAPANMYTKP